MHATPTKPGRPAAGLDYVAYAARTVNKPWFAIGGLDARDARREVVEAGAQRAVVVRAITDAADPEAAASELHATARGTGWGNEAVSGGPPPAGRPRRSPTRGTRTLTTES